MRESARKSVLALSFAAMAATAWGASPAVMARLSTAGTVWTNQVALPSGSTIRPGDRIVTGPSASASISSPETGRMEVRRDSEVTFRRDGLLLHQGVVSTQGASIATANYRVEVPAGAGENPLIVVAKRDGQLLVAAHRGNALVTAPGLAPVLIPAGNFAVAAVSAPGGNQNSQPGARGATANDEEDNKKKKITRRREERAPLQRARAARPRPAAGRSARLATRPVSLWFPPSEPPPSAEPWRDSPSPVPRQARPSNHRLDDRMMRFPRPASCARPPASRAGRSPALPN